MLWIVEEKKNSWTENWSHTQYLSLCERGRLEVVVVEDLAALRERKLPSCIEKESEWERKREEPLRCLLDKNQSMNK